MAQELAVIIPFRQAGPHTMSNLALAIASLRQQTLSSRRYRLLLVETDSIPHVSVAPLPGCDCVFAYYPEKAFCRSWAFNVGFWQAAATCYVFHEADVLAPPDLLERVLVELEDAPFVKPGIRVRDLSQAATLELHRQGISGLERVSPVDYRIRPALGACVGMRREPFERMRGFNENFAGWGGDDDEFMVRARDLIGAPKLIECEPYHLWHPQHRDPGEYMLNRVLLSEVQRCGTERISEYVSRMRTDFGNIDRYRRG
jgi:hypothetical protein